MIVCKYCGKDIYWFKTDAGKFAAMDHETRERHECAKKPILQEAQLKKCKTCGAEIYFKKAPEGNWIAMDYETEEQHRCTGAAREKDKDWAEDQDYWRKDKY